MTQQPFYPQAQQPAQPQYAQPVPQQQYAPVQPGYPQQAYPPAQPQQYAPQVPQQPAAPLADGSLDAFYSQPTMGGGPGISWKGKPDGYTVQGVVPRDVTNADVSQEVGAPNTRDAGVPQFYRDGRPKFVMAVPLQVPASAEYPEGEAKLYIRGQLREELTRAMGEAGVSGAPTAGAIITTTLVQRKQGRGTIPQNIFAVTYTPPGVPAPQVPQAQPQPVQQPVQQYAPAPQQQFVQQPVAQPQYAQHVPQQAPAQQPVQQYAPQAQAPVQQSVQQPVPQDPNAFAAAGAPGVPAGLSDQQAQLLAKLTGQQG
ncbi:hypothetical protein ASE01_19985 [Nocardioides sp. Root190]|uniref:hypothetical protein n=1 Tax=Nocardioides sp. Root190 TaxID=1736488 RepID=UPI0006F5A78E|nr:hypothetical protein [Nocardioides sp. Root190]KRB73058.1 hypothetical protein ASE01_19985 [Nocardioides sp. Root190]